MKYVLLCFRYSILAPNSIPQGFVDGKVVTEKVLAALQLDQNDYRSVFPSDNLIIRSTCKIMIPRTTCRIRNLFW